MTFSMWLECKFSTCDLKKYGGVVEASRAFNVSRQTIYNWLDGSRVPTLNNLATVAIFIAEKTDRDVLMILDEMINSLKYELAFKIRNQLKKADLVG